MLHHLKEYGQKIIPFRRLQLGFSAGSPGSSSFINKYVLERNIPITRLIEALGVTLVGQHTPSCS